MRAVFYRYTRRDLLFRLGAAQSAKNTKNTKYTKYLLVRRCIFAYRYGLRAVYPLWCKLLRAVYNLRTNQYLSVHHTANNLTPLSRVTLSQGKCRFSENEQFSLGIESEWEREFAQTC